MASADLVVHVPRSQEPARLFNSVCTEMGGVDPLLEGEIFDYYLADPWARMPSQIKKRYGGNYVEVRENGKLIASVPLQKVEATPTPAGYNPIRSQTMLMPITPALMPKKRK